jgi:hypothetical protein
MLGVSCICVLGVSCVCVVGGVMYLCVRGVMELYVMENSLVVLHLLTHKYMTTPNTQIHATP